MAMSQSDYAAAQATLTQASTILANYHCSGTDGMLRQVLQDIVSLLQTVLQQLQPTGKQ